MKQFACAGAGFSGAVAARTLCELSDCQVDVFETESHVGGHSHTERDERSGVMVHKHGPHIFNTDDEAIWRWVNRFGRFRPYEHRVRALTHRGEFNFPISLGTLNSFFGVDLTPETAKAFVESRTERVNGTPRNFEEQALVTVGREIYEAFYYGYTQKQWGIEPSRLPASVFRRVPVRFDHDDRYHQQPFVGIPEEGYTRLIENILDHPRIRLRLSTALRHADATSYDHVFVSAPLDAWFSYRLGRLRYRSLRFDFVQAHGDVLGRAQLNDCRLETPWTRTVEYKYFAPWETHEATVAAREHSFDCGDGDTPYYPMRLAEDQPMVQAYGGLAAEVREQATFVGRLGTYRYLDMDRVIGEAITAAKDVLSRG